MTPTPPPAPDIPYEGDTMNFGHRDAAPEKGEPVQVGGTYRHSKGGVYTVLAVAEHSETRERFVVYQGDSGTWARPYEMFTDGRFVALPPNPGECKHSRLPKVEFDEDAAGGLNADEIRRRWPRGVNACPDCGATVIQYASTMHYLSGDW